MDRPKQKVVVWLPSGRFSEYADSDWSLSSGERLLYVSRSYRTVAIFVVANIVGWSKQLMSPNEMEFLKEMMG